MIADGVGEAEILAAQPDLEAADIEQALRHAAEAVPERELPLAAGGGSFTANAFSPLAADPRTVAADRRAAITTRGQHPARRGSPGTGEPRTAARHSRNLPILEPLQNPLVSRRMAGPALDRVDLLRRHGVQVTAQRLAVLGAVSAQPHSTAADIEAAVRAQIGAVSLQAVYDALGALTDRGIIRRIQPAGSAARYEDRVGDNHHHLICRTCDRMVDVDCAVGLAPCLTAADDLGYEIDEAEVIYWGRCPDCAARAAAGSLRQEKASE